MPMDTGLSSPDDLNNSHQLYIHTLKSSIEPTEEFSLNELENGVTKFLNIQDERDGSPSPKSPNGKCESSKKCKATKKYFPKCPTFPCSNTTTPGEMKGDPHAIISKDSTRDDIINRFDPPCLHSPSLQTATKPVSAMKGTREKQGATPPTKLTVKWAPDVYDPAPTSATHTVTNHRPQRQTKKSSKNKHKNGTKSSRGSKHKDRKQSRKHGGSSSKSPDHQEEAEVDGGEPPPAAMDFHVGNPDHFCGSSFLKRYGESLHLSSVAEAT